MKDSLKLVSHNNNGEALRESKVINGIDQEQNLGKIWLKGIWKVRDRKREVERSKKAEEQTRVVT